MKSTEFLREDIAKLTDVLSLARMSDSVRTQILGTVEQIKRDCQPFLNEIEDPFSLLRGLRPTPDWTVHKNVRIDDRMPMSTPENLHNSLNALFQKKFGASFRNAMFCTGNLEQAKVYGMPFAIFPIGNYKYIWSPEFRDLYQKFDGFVWDSKNDENIKHLKRPNFDAGMQKLWINSINWNSYRTDGLNDAIYYQNGVEIMLRCKSYYGLNMNHIKVDKNAGPLLNAIQDYLIS